MPLISKPNYNQIFASQAPDIDKPAVFNNYPEGWGSESRPNNGKPTIKGFNYLQQTSDLKDLWILQNGACLPYDESIEYAEGAPVLKDGVIQYKTANGFVNALKTHNSLDGRDADGSHPASAILDASGETQQRVNYNGGSKWHSRVGGYLKNERAVLTNGDVVISVIEGNTNNPNTDMTGWVVVTDQIVLNSISELSLSNSNFKSVLVRSYHADLNLGGGSFYWDETGNKNKHNGGTIIDPTKAFPTDWSNQSQLTTWFTANASGLGVWRKVLSKDPSVLDFGAVGDGATDDTKAIQAAVNSGLKKITVSEGVSTIYKLTDSIRISTAGLTLSWDSNLIKFKKFYSHLNSTPAGDGSLISVAAATVLLENVGLDGNANSYGGCGIVYESAALYYTYGCRITNPDIRNTKDSCVIFKGSRGAPDIVISGGTMFTWQDPAYSGASSCGYPAIRIVGELDTGGPAPRVFDGVNASSTILLDATGMNGFKVDNCFTGTILYQGNPDVTGGTDPYRTGQGAVTNTYVRDGLVVAGFENSIDTSLSHGHAPLVWDKYGGKPTVFSVYGWEISANSVATKLGSSNVVSYQIKDNSPNGLATLNIASLYTEEIPFLPEWKGYTANPSIGDGTLSAAYDHVGKFVNFRMKLTIGSTTSRGTGEWSFTLPKWSNVAFGGHGVWSGYIVGVGRMSGTVVIYNNAAVHEIALLSTDGSTVIGSGNPANLPAGSVFNVSFYYLRG